MNSAQPVEFTLEDKRSAMWQKLVPVIQARMDLLRRKNERHLGKTDTAALRGEIAALKWVLNEVDPVDLPLTRTADA